MRLASRLPSQLLLVGALVLGWLASRLGEPWLVGVALLSFGLGASVLVIDGVRAGEVERMWVTRLRARQPIRFWLTVTGLVLVALLAIGGAALLLTTPAING